MLISSSWPSVELRSSVSGFDILGTVKDQSGAVLPGATVVITNVETGVRREAVTAARGEYRGPALNAGTYSVEATMSGFQTGVRQGVVLTIAREAIVDMALAVGNVTEQVTVTGEAPLIETTTATVGGVVDGQQMRDIPLNARSFIELVPLRHTGGVISAIAKSGTKNFHGSVFEFLRNDNPDAAKWEDNHADDSTKTSFKLTEDQLTALKRSPQLQEYLRADR